MSVVIDIKVVGATQLAGNFRKVPGDMRRAIFQSIQQSSHAIWKTSREIVRSGRGYIKAPYDSGDMMRSIREAISGGDEARIYPTVNYALYPHEGRSTSKRYGRRPFMEDAAREETKNIEEIFNRHIGKVMDQI